MDAIVCESWESRAKHLQNDLAARDRFIAELRERVKELEKQLADGDKCACGAKVDVRECYRCSTTPY